MPDIFDLVAPDKPRDVFDTLDQPAAPARDVFDTLDELPATPSFALPSLDEPPSIVGEVSKSIGRGAAQGVAGILKFGGTAADEVRRQFPTLSRIGTIDASTPESALTGLGKGLEQWAQRTMPPAKPDSFWLSTAPEALGQMVPMLAGSGTAARLATTGQKLATATATAAAQGFMLESQDALDRELERQNAAGQPNRDLALAKALGYGSIAAATEGSWGGGRLARKWVEMFGADRVADELIRRGISKNAIWAFLGRTGKDVAVNAGEEGAQRAAQDLIVDGRLDPRAIATEAAAGGLVGGVIGAPTNLRRGQRTEDRGQRTEAAVPIAQPLSPEPALAPGHTRVEPWTSPQPGQPVASAPAPAPSAPPAAPAAPAASPFHQAIADLTQAAADLKAALERNQIAPAQPAAVSPPGGPSASISAPPPSPAAAVTPTPAPAIAPAQPQPTAPPAGVQVAPPNAPQAPGGAQATEEDARAEMERALAEMVAEPLFNAPQTPGGAATAATFSRGDSVAALRDVTQPLPNERQPLPNVPSVSSAARPKPFKNTEAEKAVRLLYDRAIPEEQEPAARAEIEQRLTAPQRARYSAALGAIDRRLEKRSGDAARRARFAKPSTEPVDLGHPPEEAWPTKQRRPATKPQNTQPEPQGSASLPSAPTSGAGTASRVQAVVDKMAADVAQRAQARASQEAEAARLQRLAQQNYDTMGQSDLEWLAGRGDTEAQKALSTPLSVRARPTTDNGQRTTDQPTNARHAKDQALLETVRQKLAAVGGADLEAVLLPAGKRGAGPVPRGGASPGFTEAVRSALEKIFRVRIIAVRRQDGRPTLFHGVIPDPGRRLILIDSTTDKPVLAVAGHELGHVLESQHPKLYQDLLEAIAPLIDRPAAGSYLYSLNQARAEVKLPPLRGREAVGELVNDFLGDNLAEPAFWQDLQSREPGLFGRLARTVLDWLKRVLGNLPQNYGASEYFTDLKKAREVVAKALREFAAEEARGTRGKEKAGSVARPGLTDNSPSSSVKSSMAFSFQSAPGEPGDASEDARYLAAVKNGDETAAAAMVEAAAKRAGYTIGPVWHSSRNWERVDKASELQVYGGSDENTQVDGVYFARARERSEEYGAGSARPFYLRFQNPWRGDIADFYAANHREAVGRLQDSIAERHGVGDRMEVNDDTSAREVLEAYEDLLAQRGLEENLEEYLGRVDSDDAGSQHARAISSVEGSGSLNPGLKRLDLENAGHDGQDDDWQLVAFTEGSIKSAATIERDGDGNIIPLSQRFNPQENNFRFSLRTNLRGGEQAEEARGTRGLDRRRASGLQQSGRGAAPLKRKLESDISSGNTDLRAPAFSLRDSKLRGSTPLEQFTHLAIAETTHSLVLEADRLQEQVAADSQALPGLMTDDARRDLEARITAEQTNRRERVVKVTDFPATATITFQVIPGPARYWAAQGLDGSGQEVWSVPFVSRTQLLNWLGHNLERKVMDGAERVELPEPWQGKVPELKLGASGARAGELADQVRGANAELLQDTGRGLAPVPGSSWQLEGRPRDMFHSREDAIAYWKMNVATAEEYRSGVVPQVKTTGVRLAELQARLASDDAARERHEAARRGREEAERAATEAQETERKVREAISDAARAAQENPDTFLKSVADHESSLVAVGITPGTAGEIIRLLEDKAATASAASALTEPARTVVQSAQPAVNQARMRDFAALLDERYGRPYPPALTRKFSAAALDRMGRVWRDLARQDEAWTYPRSKAKLLANIANEMSRGTITAGGSGETRTLNGPNGSITIYEATTRTPYIRSIDANSSGKKAGGGKLLYQIAGDWALANGKTIVPDPAGITKINAYSRRTANMISSMLRHGTSAHWAPNPSQNIRGWVAGDHAHNIAAALIAEMEHVESAFPRVKELTVDWEAGIITDRNGTPVDRRGIEDRVRAANPKGFANAEGVGETTVKRAIVTRAALSELDGGTVGQSAGGTARGQEVASRLAKSEGPLLFSLRRETNAELNRLQAKPERSAQENARITELQNQLGQSDLFATETEDAAQIDARKKREADQAEIERRRTARLTAGKLESQKSLLPEPGQQSLFSLRSEYLPTAAEQDAALAKSAGWTEGGSLEEKRQKREQTAVAVRALTEEINRVRAGGDTAPAELRERLSAAIDAYHAARSALFNDPAHIEDLLLKLNKINPKAGPDSATAAEEIGAELAQVPGALLNKVYARLQDEGKLPRSKTLPGVLSSLQSLTDWLAEHDVQSPRRSLAERIDLPGQLAERKARFQDAWQRARAAVAETWQRAWKSFTTVPVDDDFRATLKDWKAWDERSGLETHQFQRQIRRQVEDPVRRAAITVWLQAGGAPDVIKAQAAAIPARYARFWQTALQLTPSELDLARAIMADWQAKLADGMSAGIVEAAHANYAPQVWKKPPQQEVDGTELPSGAAAGNWAAKLDTRNPFFYYHKAFHSYFEGIMAGGVPRTLDVGDLVGLYNVAANKALSSRAMVKALMDAKAPDNRPMVIVSGHAQRMGSAAGARGFMVDAKYRGKEAVTADGRDYKPIDHPALRDWKWVERTDDGQGILTKGDMLVHPDRWRFLKNLLVESHLRERDPSKGPILQAVGTIARPLLRLNYFLKSSKLALGTFHLATEGEHALFHSVNPWNGKFEVNFEEPDQAGLVRGGLDLGMSDAWSLFSEGLSSQGGLFARIPGIGTASQKFTEWLFKDYIPTLKMRMALHALARNRTRYRSKLTAAQSYDLTATQANAAFGGMNYRLMGRDPFLMDVMRLLMLAPDFLEARMRFVGQALKPYGAEQRRALLLMAGTVYVGARILNYILDDDPHWELENAFSVIAGNRKWTLRTIVQDAWHLIYEPRSFFFNRLSPIARTGVELATSRDWRGIRRDFLEQVGDALTWLAPVGTEGFLPGSRGREQTAAQMIGVSVGIGSRRHTAGGQIRELAGKFNRKSADPAARRYQDAIDRESHLETDYRRLDNRLEQGDLAGARKEYEKLTTERNHKPAVVERRYATARPFTGTKEREAAFLKTLNPHQRALYEKAQAEHRAQHQAFLEMLRK